MPKIIKEVSNDKYIGTVYGYDIASRELDVYIPKLMPGIPEGVPEITTMTNASSLASAITVNYNPSIKMASTIKVKAANVETPLPDIGSKVIVEFLDGNPRFSYWQPWNYNNDHVIIEEERYPEYYKLRIKNKEVSVNKDDIIEIQLPDDYNIISITDEENPKRKIFKIIDESDLNKRLTYLEKLVGNPRVKTNIVNEMGQTQEIEVEATGVFKDILYSRKHKLKIYTTPVLTKSGTDGDIVFNDEECDEFYSSVVRDLHIGKEFKVHYSVTDTDNNDDIIKYIRTLKVTAYKTLDGEEYNIGDLVTGDLELYAEFSKVDTVNNS